MTFLLASRKNTIQYDERSISSSQDFQSGPSSLPSPCELGRNIPSRSLASSNSSIPSSFTYAFTSFRYSEPFMKRPSSAITQ